MLVPSYGCGCFPKSFLVVLLLSVNIQLETANVSLYHVLYMFSENIVQQNAMGLVCQWNQESAIVVFACVGNVIIKLMLGLAFC